MLHCERLEDRCVPSASPFFNVAQLAGIPLQLSTGPAQHPIAAAPKASAQPALSGFLLNFQNFMTPDAFRIAMYVADDVVCDHRQVFVIDATTLQQVYSGSFTGSEPLRLFLAKALFPETGNYICWTIDFDAQGNTVASNVETLFVGLTPPLGIAPIN